MLTRFEVTDLIQLRENIVVKFKSWDEDKKISKEFC